MTEHSPVEMLNRNIGSILAALCVSAIVGAYGLVHQNDTNNRITLERIDAMTREVNKQGVVIEKIRDRIESNAHSGWSKEDQKRYTDLIDDNIKFLIRRVKKLEEGY